MRPQQLRAILQATFLLVGLPLLFLYGVGCICGAPPPSGSDNTGAPPELLLQTQDIQATDGTVSRSHMLVQADITASAGEAQAAGEAFPSFFVGLRIPTAPGSAQPGQLQPGASAYYYAPSQSGPISLTEDASKAGVLSSLFPPPAGSQWTALVPTDPHQLDTLFGGPINLIGSFNTLNYAIDFGGTDPCNGCEVQLTACFPAKFAAFFPSGMAVGANPGAPPVACANPLVTYITLNNFGQPLPNAPLVAAFGLWGSKPAAPTTTGNVTLTVNLQHTGLTSLDFTLGPIQSARGWNYSWADENNAPITQITVAPYSPFNPAPNNLRVLASGLPICQQINDVVQLLATNTLTPSLQATAEGIVQVLPDPANCPDIDVAAFHTQAKSIISDGDRITYTLTISNLMNTAVDGVIEQTISPTLAIRGADLPGNCSFTSPTVTCQLTSIPANGATDVPVVLLGQGGFNGSVFSTELVNPTGAADSNYLDNVNGPLVATVSFITPTHTLTVTKGGTGTGNVVSSPPGIDCGIDCTETLDEGAVITLTATADAGSTFVDWSGACAGTDPVCTVAMDAAKTATANFLLIPTNTLAVNKAGAGSGTVTSAPAGIDCGNTCSNSFATGTVITLTASADPGSNFVDWSGDCTGTSLTCVLTLGGDSTVTATFAIATHTLTVNKTGTGSGTVTSSPPGIDCGSTCVVDLAEGTVITLTAIGDAGSIFTGWTTACLGNNPICVITMDSGKTVNANFDVAPTFPLTVTKAGAGTGTVTSTPPGIDCGATCAANFAAGATVTLTAAPVNGSTFVNWTNGCTGTNPVCQVTMSAAQTVTATFGTGTGLDEAPEPSLANRLFLPLLER